MPSSENQVSRRVRPVASATENWPSVVPLRDRNTVEGYFHPVTFATNLTPLGMKCHQRMHSYQE